MSAKLVERFVRRRSAHGGRAVRFRVDEVRLPNGKSAIREYLAHPGAVAVVPFVDKHTILLVRQYRYPVGAVTLELPAGKLDAGEPPLACIRRELREETGCTTGRIRRLLTFWPAPAFSDEALHIFVADRLRRGPLSLDDDEFLEVVEVPFRKALRWVRAGIIKDSKTIIGLLACAAPGNAAPRRRGRSGD